MILGDKMIFKYRCYKRYVNDWVLRKPKKGRGQYKKISEYLGINSVRVSQIFKGNQEMSLEFAHKLSSYLGHSESEMEYFLILVAKARAGTAELKKVLEKRISQAQAESTDLKTRLSQDVTFSEEAKAIFYSNWYYSGIRLTSSIKGLDNANALSEKLDLPIDTVSRVIEFLLKYGLCIKEGEKVKMGPKRTHLESSSPLVSRHHQNWRLKAIESMQKQNKSNLFYSGPMSLSKSALQANRTDLVDMIKKLSDRSLNDREEHLACLNIDWFQIL